MTRAPEPTLHSRPVRHRAWRNAVFVVFGLSGLAMATWVSRVPAIRDHLDVTTGELGVLIFGLAAGSIVGLLASSHVLSWLGARRTIVGSLGAVTLGLTIAGVASSVWPNYFAVFVGLALFGAGQGMCDVAMNVEGAGVERTIKRTIMPLFHAFWSFGTVLGAGLGALLVALSVAVHTHFIIIGLFVIVGAITAVRFFETVPSADVPFEDVAPDTDAAPTPTAPVRHTALDRLSIWGNGRILLIGLIVLGAAFAEGTANDWLALAMVDDRGFDQATGALLFGVFTAAMTVGRIVGVPILDRFGRVPVLRGSALLAVLGLGIVIAVPDPILTTVGIVLWGLGSALGFPVGMSAAADDPKTAAAGVSVVATIGYAAFLVGPPALGFLGEYVGLLNALIVVLVLILLAGLVAPAARPPRAP